MYGQITSNGTTVWYDTGTTSGYVDPWPTWSQTFASSTITLTNVWNSWSNSTATTSTNFRTFANSLDPWRNADAVVPAAPVLLNPPEEHWNDLRARHEAARIDRDADATRAAARVEASKLLAMVLSPGQLITYEKDKYFDVVGSEGGVYRIFHGTSGNIRRLIDGQMVNRLCVHPRLRGDDGGYLPTEDCLAAQALALMHDERGAVGLANVHAGARHLAAA